MASSEHLEELLHLLVLIALGMVPVNVKQEYSTGPVFWVYHLLLCINKKQGLVFRLFVVCLFYILGHTCSREPCGQLSGLSSCLPPSWGRVSLVSPVSYSRLAGQWVSHHQFFCPCLLQWDCWDCGCVLPHQPFQWVSEMELRWLGLCIEAKTFTPWVPLQLELVFWLNCCHPLLNTVKSENQMFKLLLAFVWVSLDGKMRVCKMCNVVSGYLLGFHDDGVREWVGGR